MEETRAKLHPWRSHPLPAIRICLRGALRDEQVGRAIPPMPVFPDPYPPTPCHDSWLRGSVVPGAVWEEDARSLRCRFQEGEGEKKKNSGSPGSQLCITDTALKLSLSRCSPCASMRGSGRGQRRAKVIRAGRPALLSSWPAFAKLNSAVGPCVSFSRGGKASRRHRAGFCLFDSPRGARGANPPRFSLPAEISSAEGVDPAVMEHCRASNGWPFTNTWRGAQSETFVCSVA